MSRYEPPARPTPYGAIYTTAPTPPKETPVPPAVTPDTELSELAAKLEAKYREPAEAGGLGRGPTETFVDPLGASRWRRDYFAHRDAGDSAATAWARVNRQINQIVGLPGDIDPSRPSSGGGASAPPFSGPIGVSGRNFVTP